MSQISYVSIFKDIRFWIVFFFILRLIGITNPLSGESSDNIEFINNMYARNFLHVDNNPLYPRLDMAGDLSGVCPNEFPLLSYLIYLVSILFGFEHWYGRAINLVITSFGLLFFNKGIKLFFSEKLAKYATLFLMISSWLTYSQSALSFPFGISLTIIGVYHGLRYFYYKSHLWNLILYLIFGMLGTLTNSASIFLFAIFIMPFLSKKIRRYRRIYFTVPSLIILSVYFFWYAFWVPYINDIHEFYYFMNNTFLQSLEQLKGEFWPVINSVFLHSIKSYMAILLLPFGMYYSVKHKRLWLPFNVLSLFFIIIIINAGNLVLEKDYFVLVFAPVLSMVMALPLIFMRTNWAVALLIVFCLESVYWQSDKLITKTPEPGLVNLSAETDLIVAKDDLIITQSNDLSLIYYANRKGWNIPDSLQLNSIQLDSMKIKGAKFLYTKSSLRNTYLSEVFANDLVYIYKLQ